MRAPLRRAWVAGHRWLALTGGIFLLLNALTGTALLVGKPLDKWSHPELFQILHAQEAVSIAIPYDAIDERLRHTFGQNTALRYRPPRNSDESLQVRVRSSWQGTVYIDPLSGHEQGRRADTEGVLNILFKFHSTLLAGEIGRMLLALLALVYVLLLLSGLIIWWPKQWPPVWRIEWRRGLNRGLFDTHRSVGAAIGILILLPMLSGAWMAWRPLGHTLNALIGRPAATPPRITLSAETPQLPLSTLIQRATEVFPQQMIGYIQPPARIDQALRIRFKLDNDPHPNGLTSVWLHPQTAQILLIERWNERDPAGHATSYIYPLHTGELGGLPLEILTALLGLCSALLGMSGFYLWWRRRQARAAQRQAGSSPHPP